MISFPASPRLSKGAIVTTDPDKALPIVITFQYNPHTLTRTLKAQTTGGEGGERSEPMRLKGAPTETFKLDVEIDAADQLEKGKLNAASMGIYPQLAALEILLYPGSGHVIANAALSALGTIEIIPPQAPFTLFIWGPKRVLPVRLTDFSVTEEAHDPKLNPIRASVSLGLQVLSYNDLPADHQGYSMFLAHQVVKETMAVLGRANDLSAVTGGEVSLL